jgi:hypothetical protein
MRILILCLTTLLAGCSSLKAKQFDSLEYNYSVSTTVIATQIIELCGNKEQLPEFNRLVNSLYVSVIATREYMRHIESTENDLEIVENTKTLVDTFRKNTVISPKYCAHKLSEIQIASRTLSRALGRKNEMNACDSDVMARMPLYAASRKNDLITDEELKELNDDLLILRTIDELSCSVQNKIKFDNFMDGLKSVLGILTGL